MIRSRQIGKWVGWMFLFCLVFKCRNESSEYLDIDHVVAESYQEASRRADALVLKRGPQQITVRDIWLIEKVDGFKIVVQG